jgi:UDP-GlcNAc:undecaprenyl-phosphate/decaprenyl-phosphate GlcNAc-1-phosphate transferase
MEAAILRVLFSIFLSGLFTFYLVPLFKILALKCNLVDSPDGAIKRHKKPTAYLGGVAIYCGFLMSLALVSPVGNDLFLFLIGVTLLLFLGLVDDLMPLQPQQKFFGQLIVAFCLLKSGFYLKEHFFYNYWNIPISLLWILSIINAVNLIDVMDGLATTVAIMATISFLIMSLLFGQWSIAIVLGAFLGSLLAFLWYNKPAAQIYLGDAGSLFIGGVLATIPFMLHWGTYNVYGYLAPIIILAIPLIEVLSLIIIRSYKGIPFYKGSLDHFASYLQSNGWNKKEILFYMTCISSMLGVVALLYITNAISAISTIKLGTFFLMSWVGILCWDFTRVENH